MAHYKLDASFDGSEQTKNELESLLRDFASQNNLHIDLQIHDRLWAAELPEGAEPPVPLANKEITDGPLE